MVHLNVIQSNAALENIANPSRNEFVWNADMTSFRIVPLRWWDDASYLAYQAGDYDDHEPITSEKEVRCLDIEKYCDDGIPF